MSSKPYMSLSAKLATPRPGPLGVFDSGYGGLTVLDPVRKLLGQYDYLYLGDNARAPYGPRPFPEVLEYTLQAVDYLFSLGCPLVILACNTASAKALRTIQQSWLSRLGNGADPGRRVLGVIRPTAEVVGNLSATGHVGILATEGTIKSGSYVLAIGKFFPQVRLTGLACPRWVALVESGQMFSDEAHADVAERLHTLLSRDPDIDCILLGCTHYPLLLPVIRHHLPPGVRVVTQGDYVATSLANYLHRHPEMEARLEKGATCRYLTTGSPELFRAEASRFLAKEVHAEQVCLPDSREWA